MLTVVLVVLGLVEQAEHSLQFVRRLVGGGRSLRAAASRAIAMASS